MLSVGGVTGLAAIARIALTPAGCDDANEEILTIPVSSY